MNTKIRLDRSLDLASRGLLDRYLAVRAETEARAEPLTPEDQQIQSMPDCSPAKWHRAHTTWFFETFILAGQAGYAPFDPAFGYLFNSYYEAAGSRHPRPERGMLTRPSADTVGRYRAHVDQAMAALLEGADLSEDTGELIELGLQHEQQHQELLLTDIKHAFGLNPIRPAYQADSELRGHPPGKAGWVELPAGIYEAGAGEGGFAFDHERPRHRHYLHRSRIATQPVTCRDYLEFMSADGYRRAEFWLSEGWATVKREGWEAPLYWTRQEGDWRIFRLNGEGALNLDDPVQHLSFYEASAYAAWRGRRLPTEFEWEVAVARHGFDKMGVGAVWEWTSSAFLPYPGFRQAAGAVGEYNGKFMSGQMILRGASWATPRDHSRPTYRNSSRPPPAGRRPASGSRRICDAVQFPTGGPGRPVAQHRRVSRQRLGRPRPAAQELAGQVLLRCRRLAPVRGDLRDARILPDPHRTQAVGRHRP
jgi:ergothioneine biosynthesis protein EgtB